MTRKPTAEREYGFKRRVKLGKSKHSWESHADADTLLKDVLHWLDLLAANTPGRLVFASMPAILKKCNARRVRNKLEPCAMRHLKKVFAVLRDMHVVSKYFKTWDGRYGFIFEPHDARCSVEHGICVKHTYTSKQLEAMRKNWPSESTLRGTVGALEWHRRGTGAALFGAPEAAFRGAVRGTFRGTAQDVKPTDCEELTDEQVAKWMAENVQAEAPKVCKVVGFEGSKVSRVTKEGDQEQVQRQQEQQKQSERVSSSEAKPKTVEATPKVKQPGRKRDVQSQRDYELDRATAEFKAELAARPPCPKCGAPHPADPNCTGRYEEPKRRERREKNNGKRTA